MSVTSVVLAYLITKPAERPVFAKKYVVFVGGEGLEPPTSSV
jgi:hypothetical protein